MIYNPGNELEFNDIPQTGNDTGIIYDPLGSEDFSFQPKLVEKREQGKEIYRHIITTVLDLLEIHVELNTIQRMFDGYPISPSVQLEFRRIAEKEFPGFIHIIGTLTTPYQIGHPTILFDNLEDLANALDALFPTERVRLKPKPEDVIDKDANKSFPSLPIGSMLILNLTSNHDAPLFDPAIELYLQDSDLDRSLINDLHKYFEIILSDIEKVLALSPGEFIIREDYSVRTDLVSFYYTKNGTSSTLIRPEEIPNLQALYKSIKDRIIEFRQRMYMIDRVHYVKALGVIAEEIVKDLSEGKQVKLKMPNMSGHDIRSVGYILFLISNMVRSFCNARNIDFSNLLKVSPEIDAEDKSIYILDDFVLSGYRMRREFYPSNASLFPDQKVKVRAIAVQGDCVFDDGNEVRAVYTFPENAFFTSTTSYCDDTFTEAEELRRLLEDISKISNIGKEFYSGGVTPYAKELVIHGYPHKPVSIFDTLAMQKLKPYNASEETKFAMRDFYKNRRR